MRYALESHIQKVLKCLTHELQCYTVVGREGVVRSSLLGCGRRGRTEYQHHTQSAGGHPGCSWEALLKGNRTQIKPSRVEKSSWLGFNSSKVMTGISNPVSRPWALFNFPFSHADGPCTFPRDSSLSFFSCTTTQRKSFSLCFHGGVETDWHFLKPQYKPWRDTKQD